MHWCPIWYDHRNRSLEGLCPWFSSSIHGDQHCCQRNKDALWERDRWSVRSRSVRWFVHRSIGETPVDPVAQLARRTLVSCNRPKSDRIDLSSRGPRQRNSTAQYNRRGSSWRETIVCSFDGVLLTIVECRDGDKCMSTDSNESTQK